MKRKTTRQVLALQGEQRGLVLQLGISCCRPYITFNLPLV